MTGAVIVGGLILLVVATFAWARISAARVDRRSIMTYGRALDVLGDVARRGESSGNVRIIPRESIGRAHVRTGGPDSELPGRMTPRRAIASIGGAPVATVPDTSGTEAGRADSSPAQLEAPPVRVTLPRSVAPERVAPVLQASSRVSERGLRALPSPSKVPERAVPGSSPAVARISLPAPVRPLRFEDDTLGDEAMVEPRFQRVVPPGGSGRQAAVRRLVTGTAAGVAVVLAVVGALQLTGGGHRAARAPGDRAPARARHHTRAGSAPHSGSGDGTAPGTVQRLVPTSTTTGDVSFQVPSRRYVLTFSDTGLSDCWVGIETAGGSGAWLWMETLPPGSTTSYEATGPVVVDLGAPRNIQVRVNGVAAELPGYALSYDLSFTTGTASA